MFRSFLLAAALCAWLAGAHAQTLPTVAFVDVNLVTMESEQVLPHMTVIVQDRRIVRIAPAATEKVPAGAVVVEGKGTRYLTPGLADMHTHIMDSGDLLPYLAHGVTTCLNLGGGDPDFIRATRTQIAAGTLTGPTVYYAVFMEGIPIHGQPAYTQPDQARAAVKQARQTGYDFAKVYNSLQPAVFDAIVAEARLQKMGVVGHGIRAIGLPQALLRGQNAVAHAEEFYYTAFDHQTDLARIPEVVRATAATGAYVIPNLSAYNGIAQQWGKPDVSQAYLADPKARLLSKLSAGMWSAAPYGKREGSLDANAAFLGQFTLAMQKAGVPLMTGTDSPFIPGLFPGDALHVDMQRLRDAGLSNYEVLSAATRVPGEFVRPYVGDAARFGVIKTGYRADLLLVEDNPLQDLKALRRQVGVMSDGRWSSAAQLQAQVDQRLQAAKR
ncbi:MAG TPA: amidohydrolase family protein [Burkholderiaceae bacterium]